MPTVFVTGATGNIGGYVVTALVEQEFTVVAAVRNKESNKHSFAQGVVVREFDFSAPTDKEVLAGCDYVFMMLPPGLPHSKEVFGRFIGLMQQAGIQHVIFISVQGAEKHSSLPHNGIEKLLSEASISHSVLRPSYFMQNLSTTWLADIKNKNRLYVPAGKAVFTWIAVEDIAAAAVAIFQQPGKHKGAAYTLTGAEQYSFFEVAGILSTQLQRKIVYRPANALLFFIQQQRKGMSTTQSLAVTLIHFLQAFQERAPITATVETLTGRRPMLLREFIEKYKNCFSKVE
ncbi:MAG TPA: NmrA family NAD(P)-binding protein [Chitinophagaceae bacterium]|nr:NmrA family NAD(P)-binding protein [Chitinophagaceae bacterium]